MADAHKILALAQTIAPGAVDEWLTNHPEATTTVEDGAISEAKLSTALAAKVNGKQDALTFDDSPTASSNNPVKSGGVASAISSLSEEIAELNGHLVDEDFYENGADTASDYYKGFTVLEQGTTYKLKVTAHTTGTYTLAASTARSSDTIVDTIASSVSFTADTPQYFNYSPSADVYYCRLWVCDDWDIEAYTVEAVWDIVPELASDVSTLETTVGTVQTTANSNKNILDNVMSSVQNNNRIDESAIISDKYYDSNGVLQSSSSGWVTTGAITMAANETVYFSLEENSTRSAAGMWFLILFSTDGTTVLDYVNTGANNYTASSAGILHFSWKPGTTKTNPFCGTYQPPYYDEYGSTYVANQALTVKPYLGVVWACVGDSMTEANSKAETHYFDYIADELGFTVLNYGISGTGYAAEMADNKAFYQRIAAITKSFDVLTILGSVNDFSAGLSLGTYTDSGTTTIGGCINAAIDAFYTLAPFKKLGIISQPPTAGSVTDGNLIGTTAQDYNDLLAQICKNRGIPFLDLFNCSGLRPWDSDYQEEYYTENGVADAGVHPNSKGQKQMATKIREFIKTVI